MSKKFLISTLVLVVGGLIGVVTISPLASAMIKKDDVLYWSIDEMIEFDAKLEAETTAACGNDEMCKNTYIYEQKNQSQTPEKYRALEFFRGACRLIFFDINPTAEKFRAYYIDKKDIMMESNPSIIEEIYIAWVDNSVPDPRYQAFWDGDDAITPYVQDMRSGIMSPGVHKLYHGTTAMFGENWFSPETKITIDAFGSHLAESQNYLIHFTVLATNSGNMLGATDYSSCFNWGTYEPGMECRIMYSGTGWPVYFPAFPGAEIPGVEAIAEPEPEIHESEPEPEPELTPISIPNSAISEQVLVSNPSTSTTKEANATAVSTPVISTSTIRVPESKTEVAPDDSSKDLENTTVEVPLSAKNEEHQFPWWFVVFIFSGITLILWWFVPISRKKDEKTIDK